MSAQPGGAKHRSFSQPYDAELLTLFAAYDSTPKATMATTPRPLDIDLHVKYIQQLDEVSGIDKSHA